jgi:lactate dehydrogenase-like 2-hydroxyacid dehydrogenase
MAKKNKILVVIAGKNFKSIKDCLQEYDDLIVRQVDVNKNIDKIEKCDILIPTMTHIGKDIIEGIKKLKLIQQWGAGLEGIDVDAATKKGIAVANVPTNGTYNAESVAE